MNGTINVELGDDELASRRAAWVAPERPALSGYLWKYAQGVGSALNGAVTHPGGASNIKTYADL